MVKAYAISTADNKTGEKDCDVVFKPGAERVRAAYSGGSATFRNGLGYPASREDLLKKIAAMPSGLDFFAYFGHGFTNQLGGHIRLRSDIKLLADALGPKMKPGGSIMFYSCLAGSQGGLTTSLMDDIGKDLWIYGHTASGHSFTFDQVSEVHNSDGRRFRSLPEFYGAKLAAAWQYALLKTDLWLRFPLMQHVDIIKELHAIRLPGTWMVRGSTKYVFDWQVSNKSYASFDDICINPSGTVRNAATGQTGQWELDEQLEIVWGPREKEIWPLPIDPDAQKINGGGTAKRVAWTRVGKPQG